MSSLQLKNRPTYQGEWLSIYFTPIPGSQERFTILVAAIGDDGEFRIAQTFNRKMLRSLYGEAAERLQGVIAWVMESLLLHLRQQGRFEGWLPPVTGVTTGEPCQSRSHNLTGLINQGLRLTSSLSTLLTPESDVEEESQRQQQFAFRVRNALIDLNPAYQQQMNREVQLLRDCSVVRVGFLSKSYVADFAAIANNTTSENSALRRVIILDDLLQDKLTQVGMAELLLAPPIGFRPEKTDDFLIRAQRERMELVKREAERRAIRCLFKSSAEEVAHHIHERVA